MSTIAERARVWRTGEGTSGGERVGVRGGRCGSKLGRFGVARHWCLYHIQCKVHVLRLWQVALCYWFGG